jgi:ABC-type phosphate/phosphonate transport system substrate-binding protein
MAFIPMTADPGEEQSAVAALVEHVERGSGLRIEPIRTASYAEAEAALTEGDADVAVLSPLLYVRVLDRFRRDPALAGVRIRLLLTAVSGGSPTGLGYVVAAADSGIEELDQIAGRSFGMVRGSTSAYLFPLDLLAARGLDPDAVLTDVRFYDRHPQILEQLLRPAGSREVDVGALYHHTVDSLDPDDRARLRIVGKTARIPRDALVARVPIADGREDPDALCAAAALQHALLDLSGDPAAARRVARAVGYDGWIPGDDRRYDVTRTVAERFGHYRPDRSEEERQPR